MKKIGLCFLLVILPAAFSSAADTYVIDTKGSHAFVQFKAKHLGYSWLYGRFNRFEGEFTYDPKDDAKNKVNATVDVTSLDSNHSERDKHLRAGKYLNTGKYAEAKFESTSYKALGNNKAKMKGKLTLMGTTKEVELDVEVIGGGEDPWGGYRQGFEAKTTINPKDFGMKANIGEVELTWSVEGVKK
ncbi:MAG: YceI family protein [Agarilytica sp.]